MELLQAIQPRVRRGWGEQGAIERPVQHERRQHLTQLVARYREFYPKVVVELTLSQRTPDQSEDRHDVIITFARELPDSQMVAQLLGAMLGVLCAALAYLKKRGVPMRPMDLRQRRYLRLLGPLYEDSQLFNGEHGELDALPAESFQLNVGASLAKPAPADMGVLSTARRCVKAN